MVTVVVLAESGRAPARCPATSSGKLMESVSLGDDRFVTWSATICYYFVALGTPAFQIGSFELSHWKTRTVFVLTSIAEQPPVQHPPEVPVAQ